MSFVRSHAKSSAAILSSVTIRFTTLSGEISTGPALPNLLESQTSVTSRAAAIRARFVSAISKLRSAEALLEMHAVGREEQPVGEDFG